MLTQPEVGFYLVGIKSYGRAPSFLLQTGYEQVVAEAAATLAREVAQDTVDALTGAGR